MVVLEVLFIFGFIIAFHEFGHFIVARMLGMKVDYFSIGFGPVIFGFKYRGTEFLLSAIPAGGYVKPAGPNFREDLKADDPDNGNYLVSRPPWQKFLVYVAGPLFNLLLAIVLVAGMTYCFGIPTEPTTTIESVAVGSPAEKAGLKGGDRIIAVEGRGTDSWEKVVSSIQESSGETLRVEIERRGEPLMAIVNPTVVSNKRMIGIMPVFKTEDVGLFDSVLAGVRGTWAMSKMQLSGLVGLITGKFSPKDMSGPIGIMQATGKAAESGWKELISFVIMINVCLGVLNLLPVPVLDGGWIMLAGIEMLLGRPLSKNVQAWLLGIGTILMLSLMFFASYIDILRLMGK